MLFEIFDGGKFLGFEDAEHEEAAILAFANKRRLKTDPFRTLTEVRQDQDFAHHEATAVSAYATMPTTEPATEAELTAYRKAFELLALADEAKATAERLRAAAGRTTGQAWRENTEGAERMEAEAARLRGELSRLNESPADAGAPVDTPTGRRKTQAERIGELVGECERRAAACGATFERGRMPGTKADLLALLHSLDVEMRSMKTVDSLDRYLSATGCKWPLNAGKQSSAAPLYARLFPEAPIRAPGAVSPQRRKA